MTESVPRCSVEGGNTKPPSTSQKLINPAIRWCFTLNNYTNDDLCSIVPTIESECRLGFFGKEIGKSGTPHLQGYIELDGKGRPKGIFGIDRIHWEKAKGNLLQNYQYCCKEDKNPYVFDPKKRLPKIKKPVKVIQDSQLYNWQKDIVKAIKTEPDDRTIHWYWSHKGDIGKTSFCKYLTINFGAICLHGKGADVRNGICDYLKNKGDTPSLIVFPIPRSYDAKKYLSYEALENIKDMYFYSGKYEGGMVCGNPPHLIVFANNPPDTSKMSEDRWNIVCLDPENGSDKIGCALDVDSDTDSSSL